MTQTILMVGGFSILDDVAEALAGEGLTVVRRRNAPSDADLAQAGILVSAGDLQIGAAMLAKAPALHAVISPFTGVEGFDQAAATAAGVLVVSGQVAENYESMAEATVLLILAALYDLGGAQRQFREGLYIRRDTPVRMLKGKTVGLIGLGQIARSVAHRLTGWDCQLIAYAPRLREPAPAGVDMVPLRALLERSDVVCVLAALNGESRNMLDREALGRLKPGAVLVNTARGGIIDEAALAEIAPKLGTIALDVFETEPLPADSPLRNLSNAILTPHAIGHTEDVTAAIPVMLRHNILEVLAGRAPSGTRNLEAVTAWRKRRRP